MTFHSGWVGAAALLCWAGLGAAGDTRGGAGDSSGARRATAAEILEFALAQWRSYPEMRIEDAYKWLFQAALGGEHAIRDDAGPRKWLEEEWAGLGEPLEGERLAEALRPDGSLLRIHLRPYRAGGGDPERVLDAFVQSAGRFTGDQETFLGAWRQLGRRLGTADARQESARNWRFGYPEWKALDDAMGAQGYPAVHHSKPYEEAYRPAYRVVLARVWSSQAAK